MGRTRRAVPVTTTLQTGQSHPFALVDAAAGLITFVEEVFDGREREQARTPMPSGSAIHAEVAVGDSVLLLADRQPGRPLVAALLRVYGHDAQAVSDRATARGAVVVTEVTPFYGEDPARLRDPWGNLWWLCAPARGEDAVPPWEGGTTSVFDSLDTALRGPVG